LKWLAILLLAGCTSMHAQSLAEKQIDILRRDLAWYGDTIPILRYNPPYAYSIWRETVERCSGLSREGWPRFYVANIDVLPGQRGAFYAGNHNVVVFALGYEVQPWAFMHEILHFLHHPHVAPIPLGETDEEQKVRTHPDSLFRAKCGPFVNPRG
jgi:hypothetical protein